jgi:hypothetical protein
MEYMDMLKDFEMYIEYGCEGDVKYRKDVFNWGWSEREFAKVLAYVCYYIDHTLMEKNIDCFDYEGRRRARRGPLKYALRDCPELLATVQYYNYFDLPDYEAMVQTALKDLEEE